VESPLGTGGGEAKSRHDFVENKDCARSSSDIPEEFQIARSGKVKAGVPRHGFDNDGGDVVWVGGKRGFDGFHVVVRQDNRMLGKGGRNAGAVGMAEGQGPAASLNEQGVGMAVITAVKLDDFIAFGVPARQADGAHAGFGAAVGHAHLFDAGNHAANQLGHRQFERVGNSKAGAKLGRVFDGGDNFGVSVSENSRAPSHHVIDKFVAIDVPNFAALGFIDKERRPAHSPEGTDRRIHPTGNIIQGLGEELFGFDAIHETKVAKERGFHKGGNAEIIRK